MKNLKYWIKSVVPKLLHILLLTAVVCAVRPAKAATDEQVTSSGPAVPPRANPESADGILRFPVDANMIVVTDYGAVPDDGQDDTAALQASVEAAISVWPKKHVYIPKGTYDVSGTIMGRIMAKKDAPKGSGWVSHMVLIGESREGTIIRLKDKAAGFDDPSQPRAVIMTGSEADLPNPTGGGNRAFAQRIVNLTVDTGRSNPGAVGIDFITSNTGAVSDVNIRSGDDVGVAGIAMNRNWPGPGLIRNVKIEGFDYGIQMLKQAQYGMTFEHIYLSRQRKAGMAVEQNCAFVRGLHSDNKVPAVEGDNNAIVALVDSDLTGGAAEVPAIRGNGQLFARNITTNGYGQAIEWSSKKGKPQQIAGPHVDEFTSQTPIQFGPGKSRSLNLPVRETPTFHDNDLSHWVRVAGTTADDLQAAIDATSDTDKTTVYLPNRSPQSFVSVNKTIIVRGNVRKIVSCGGELKMDKGFVEANQPTFRVEDGPGPIIFEGFRSLQGKIEQNSTRDVVLRSVMNRSAGGFQHVTADATFYNTPRGTGAMFVEDAVAEVTVNPGGTFFARQLNCEFGTDPVLENHGGTAWVLGFKDEMGLPFNTVLANTNGGRTEMLGFFHYVLKQHGQGDVPVIINDNSTLSILFIFNGNKINDNFIKEKRGQDWKMIKSADVPRRIPLLVTRPDA